ncbi:MAG: NAD-dependent epimerase/dehydratase family protein [Candidatus Omnitrophota bacterium]
MSTKEIMVVTGGAGFIGSHLTQGLLDQGYQVRVLDNLSQGKREWVPSKVEFFEGDILDRALLNKVFEGASGVFHLAAMSKVAPSMEKPEFCTEQNILGTQNVLIEAQRAKVKKVVYAASSTYYGSQKAPQQEDMFPQPLNPYALSKLVGEHFCELWTRIYNLKTVSLRYFNVYGPRQPSVGAYALVLGIFLKQLKEGRPLTIHGDGLQRRDFIYVSDVVEANIAAYKSEASGIVLNVGSGTNISVKELADMISKNQVFEPRRAGDAQVTLADITKIQNILQWRPKVSFEEGLAKLIEAI